MDWSREGINGHYYCEERYLSGDYSEGQFRRTRIDPDYHHRRLFWKGEPHTVIHKTEEAVLFEVAEGRFWVPKALLRGDLVHKNFVRSYLPTPEEMFK